MIWIAPVVLGLAAASDTPTPSDITSPHGFDVDETFRKELRSDFGMNCPSVEKVVAWLDKPSEHLVPYVSNPTNRKWLAERIIHGVRNTHYQTYLKMADFMKRNDETSKEEGDRRLAMMVQAIGWPTWRGTP